MFYTKSGPSTHRKDNQLRSALNVGANPGQSKGPERDMAPGPCLMSGGSWDRKHPQKGGGDSVPSRGRLQPSRQAERALLRKKRGKGAGR